MVSQKEGLLLLSRSERLGFIKRRHQSLILDARGEIDVEPIEEFDDTDIEEPAVEVTICFDDSDYGEN